MTTATKNSPFPVNPLDKISQSSDDTLRRRIICGVLESYNGSYDTLSEGVQNAVDAIEDAKLNGAKGPFLLEVTLNLDENWLSIMDTGVGMIPEEVAGAFAPNVSYKDKPDMLKKREKSPYRGYKGVGLTFLAYGTDDIVMHSKSGGVLTKGRMQYGRAWATGKRTPPALVVEDSNPSPLDGYAHGTFVKVQFSDQTRPKSLSRLASTFEGWSTILTTRTAAGQILLNLEAVVQIDLRLTLVSNGRTKSDKVTPSYLYPHTVKRTPPFRFLNLNDYFKAHAEQSSPPADKIRQDGLYLVWDAVRIAKELSEESKREFAEELKVYSPVLYAFVPYQGSVWGDINQLSTGVKNRVHLNAGLLIALNRQRLVSCP